MKNIYVTSRMASDPCSVLCTLHPDACTLEITALNVMKAIEDTLTHLRSFLQPTKMMGVSGQNLRICWCQNVLQCCSVSSLVMS